MRLYAISDLHLPGGNDKPMDIFGDHWTDHFAHISQDWCARVKDEDVVLVPGDISWAMQMPAVLPDLQAIGRLPGRKILLRGNHDYWWSSLTQVRLAMPEGMSVIQNDAIDLGECVVCGTRGWMFATGEEPLTAQDEKILNRQLLRLRLSLEEGVKLATGRPLVVMLHYPPLYQHLRKTPFTEVLAEYPVRMVVYGHLHGNAIRYGFSGQENGVEYRLVSCDALGFRLEELPL